MPALIANEDYYISLEGKLKCLIFIPIISQTYCDPKSFAWQHEFLAFNKLVSEGAPLSSGEGPGVRPDLFGRDIKLSNGNVASRILPVKIHDLDAEDKALLENELGGVLRAIEFIYRESGVNRPLKSTDHKNDNQNKTDYRNQINKLANAVKEIIYSIIRPSTSINAKNNSIVPLETIGTKQSVAVLPFSNMSSDPEQEYFSEGITENIIIELATNHALRIISRTSMMRYKRTTKSVPEIAAELDVRYILEGAVQVRGNKVRINVQLVHAEKDDLVWSKVFVENMNDIFEIQSHVAEVVAKELDASIGTKQSKTEDEVPTKNPEAYNLFLKGRHAFNQWGVEGYRVASDYYKQAIALDPDFTLAYSFLASSYSARMSWNGDLSPKEAQLHIEKYLAEAWKRGPSENDYLTKAFIAFFIAKDFSSAEQFLLKAIDLGPNNATVRYTYSYLLNMMGRFEEALQWVNQAKSIDPLTVAYFNYQAISLYMMGKQEDALLTIKEGLQLYPAVLRFYDFMARIYLTLERWADAEEAVLAGFRSANIRPPSMVAYLAIAYSSLKETAKRKALLDELIRRSNENEKGVNIYIVYLFNAMGDVTAALPWLSKARETNDVDLIWWEVDPLLKNIREHLSEKNSSGSPDFEGAEKYIMVLLEKEMPKLPYHNLDHIKDVLAASLNIAQHEQLGADEIKLLRVAALLHDAGFIRSAKNHEANGAEMARQLLPVYGLKAEQIEMIVNMILATRLPQSPAIKLEKILCDADLDYLGRSDFYDIGRLLLEELKAQGVVETEREWNLVQKTFLESHRFHTDYSKANRETFKQERLQEIIAKLKNRS